MKASPRSNPAPARHPPLAADARILLALRQAADASVSGAELSHALGISRAAVWARIRELRSLGYVIEAKPHLGYQLIAAPDLLHPDDLMARTASAQIIGRDIRVFEKTTSTNDVVGKLARDAVAEGVAVFAETQTKGRGRLGRHWSSLSRKGLWFSLLLRPPLQPQSATQLTIAAAVALRRAIVQATGLSGEIKWPNDLLLRGKKFAGILLELHAELDTVEYVILGIGIDVNLALSDFPADLRKTATSLKIESGQTIDRAELAAAALRELDGAYQILRRGDFTELAEEWEAHCHTIGQNVSIQVGERVIQGRAESVDRDGALLVRTQHGLLERVVGGDVLLQKP